MFVSVAEAAVTLRIPVNVLREMCERGLIEGAVRFGRIWTMPEHTCRGDNFRLTDSLIAALAS